MVHGQNRWQNARTSQERKGQADSGKHWLARDVVAVTDWRLEATECTRKDEEMRKADQKKKIPAKSAAPTWRSSENAENSF